MKCTQCDSKNLIRNVKALDRGHMDSKQDLSLEIYRDPNAMFFKQAKSLKLKPVICADCGFVMFKLSSYSLGLLKKHKKE